MNGQEKKPKNKRNGPSPVKEALRVLMSLDPASQGFREVVMTLLRRIPAEEPQIEESIPTAKIIQLHEQSTVGLNWELLEPIIDLGPESEEFKNHLAVLLEHLTPGDPFGTKLFNAVARITPSIAFEAVALRHNRATEAIEILLRRRADDDTAYPGEWHAAGSVYRQGEDDRQVADRLEAEFGTKISDFKFAGKFYQSEARGTFHSMVFLITLLGEPRIDDRHQWFPVSQLPENTVEHHRTKVIPMAMHASSGQRCNSKNWL